MRQTNGDLAFRIGPLLYTPGLKTDIAEKFISYKDLGLLSAAICLEDTVNDSMVAEAEANTVREIGRYRHLLREMNKPADYLNLFIRVRCPEQIFRLTDALGDNGEDGNALDCLCGYIIPKIDDETVSPYLNAIKLINRDREKPLYLMPIIENPSLLDAYHRHEKLFSLRRQLTEVSRYILNIRVGGNDFCNVLGAMNDINETIYDIPPIAALLSDIAVMFTPEFVVSGAVWNYFDNNSSDLWLKGMLREIKKDRNMGFIGKTIIHPCQIAPVINSLKVTQKEYCDAKMILASADGSIQVFKSCDGSRMYETKVHSKWARKIIRLESIYGIREESV